MSNQESASTELQVATLNHNSETLPEAPEPLQNSLYSFVPLLFIFVVFYFIIFRPQEKKRKEQEQLISTLKAGEEVLLHSGIYGKVISINQNDNTATISIAENASMKIMLSAIADIISRKNPVSTPTASNTTKSKGKK